MKWSEAYKHAGLGVWVPIKLIHAIGAKSAIFTSQLFYWTGKERNGDGWVYKTKDEWEMETGLSRREQDTCVEDLKRKKILETRYERLEHRLYYRVSEEALDAIMEADSPGESTKAPFGKGGKRLSPKADSVFRHIDQRLPSENTTKTVQGESRPPAKRLVRRTRRLDSSSSSFCMSAKPEESQPPAITTQPAAEPAPSGVGLTPEKETARPLLTFGPTEDDSPREVAEKLIEKYELSDYQGGQIEDYRGLSSNWTENRGKPERIWRAGHVRFAVMTWGAAGSNSFSPDHRPGFAAGAVPFTTASGITNEWRPWVLMCSWIRSDSRYYPANALPARRAGWDAAQGS
jgi:hypothetical protein